MEIKTNMEMDFLNANTISIRWFYRFNLNCITGQLSGIKQLNKVSSFKITYGFFFGYTHLFYGHFK